MGLFSRPKSTSTATVCPESKTSSLSSITHLQNRLIDVPTRDHPPTKLEEEKRQKVKKRAFENKKKERSNRIQALMSKARKHQSEYNGRVC